MRRKSEAAQKEPEQIEDSGDESLKTHMLNKAVEKAKDAHRGKASRKGLWNKSKTEHFEHREKSPVQGDTGVFCPLPEIMDHAVWTGAEAVASTLFEVVAYSPWGITENELEEVVATYFLFAYVMDPGPNMFPRNMNPGASKVWKDVFSTYGSLIDQPKTTARQWGVAVATFIRRCNRLGIDPWVQDEDQEQDEGERVREELKHAVEDQGPEVVDDVLSAAVDVGFAEDKQAPVPSGVSIGGFILHDVKAVTGVSKGQYDGFISWQYSFVRDPEPMSKEDGQEFLRTIEAPLHQEDQSERYGLYVSPIVDGFQARVEIMDRSFDITCRFWMSEGDAEALVATVLGPDTDWEQGLASIAENLVATIKA